MMGWTNRHFRVFLRLLGGDAWLLYSEMVTTGAICYGDYDHYLAKSDEEGDVILQLGGSDPIAIAKSIQLSEKYQYAGYNLNVGCPSDRVQNGKIGACLMKEPQLVCDVLKAMKESTDKPISIKTRLGIDGVDSYDYLKSFVDDVLPSGVDTWIFHARDAWLTGLNPKQNRSIPPLRYEYVYRLKEVLPDLHITLNGGLKDIETIEKSLDKVDAVMLGRACYQQTPLIHQLGSSEYSYMAAICQYINYIENNITERNSRIITVPLVTGLVGYPGVKKDRALIAECRKMSEVLERIKRLKDKLLLLC